MRQSKTNRLEIQKQMLLELKAISAFLDEIHIDIHELADARIPRDPQPEKEPEGEDT